MALQPEGFLSRVIDAVDDAVDDVLDGESGGKTRYIDASRYDGATGNRKGTRPGSARARVATSTKRTRSKGQAATPTADPEAARFALRSTLAATDPQLAARAPWAYEVDRWHELVFLVLGEDVRA